MSNKDLFHLDISDCELTDLWAEPMPRINILRNLKTLNASYNKIVDIRQLDLMGLDSLQILDLTGNEMRCDDEFKSLLKWLQKKNVSPSCSPLNNQRSNIIHLFLQIKSGGSGDGLSANLKKDELVETAKNFNSWTSFENAACKKKIAPAQIPQVDVDASKDEDIVDDVDDDEYDDDDEDDDADDENDNGDTEVITKDTLIAEEMDVIKGLNDRLMDRKYHEDIFILQIKDSF